MPDDLDEPDRSRFSFRRLLLVGTGALGVCSLPGWVGWLRENHAYVETKVALTRQATEFVSPAALTAIGGRPLVHDVWPAEPRVTALHVELCEWADAVAVFPATFHFVSRFALGLADTPVMLALQCSTAPIGLAPALPPGGFQSHAMRSHLAALRERPNVVVADPAPGRSVTTGDVGRNAAAPLPALLELVEKRHAELAAGREAGEPA
ncbi:flavoprotein [Streptomyces leeuwenhoekii]|jgi:phosphopantothenoylcysteine decarboxylase/phosphopantothenate--cysteine ligase|uniref:flavoprotein n=1 Tax=Streptomyces leeuwenhoekii TaxID=1437453 RepID=UPI0036784414